MAEVIDISIFQIHLSFSLFPPRHILHLYFLHALCHFLLFLAPLFLIQHLSQPVFNFLKIRRKALLWSGMHRFGLNLAEIVIIQFIHLLFVFFYVKIGVILLHHRPRLRNSWQLLVITLLSILLMLCLLLLFLVHIALRLLHFWRMLRSTFVRTRLLELSFQVDSVSNFFLGFVHSLI